MMLDNELDRLYHRIDALDRNAPFVWRLAITADEFQALEAALLRLAANGVTALLNSTWALRCVVYLAEWYKRRYDGGTTQPAIALGSSELETLWACSGINQSLYLYKLENGNKSWRYSLYVLGGLAMPFELGKADTRYLKELCKLYHGENDQLDNLDESDRAAAFRQSILQRGSLYEYLRSILNGGFPFAEEDKKDSKSIVNQFIDRVKTADDEVLRSKFRLEWRIIAPSDSTNMKRILRLHLKPEEIGEGLHQYLRFDRVHLWGIAHPETQKTLRFYVRFWNGKQAIPSASSATPMITYYNTGSNDTGFLAWGVQNFVTVSDIPPEAIDVVEIIAVEDDGTEHQAEKITIEEWMQLFRVNAYEDEWSSIQNPQHESALLCSDRCQMLDITENEVIYHRVFANRKQSGAVNLWRHIHELVHFIDSKGREHTLFNRQGYDQITASLHTNILRYSTAGMVTCLQWDDETEDYDESQLPLLLTKNDLIVRHFATRSDLQDAKCELITKPDKIEFKQNGNYFQWNEDNRPSQGQIKLRITVKGRENLLTAYYFPKRITRDCEKHCIQIGEKICQDSILFDGRPLDPVMTFEEGNDEEKIRLAVWRPTLHKEIIRDGRVAQYVQPQLRAALPYILKNDVVIQDFNKAGYKKYKCSDLSSIYALSEFSPVGNHNLMALQDSRKVSARELDQYAPEWFDVCLSLPLDFQANTAIFCHWNYFAEDAPEQTQHPTSCPDNEIDFFDLKDSAGINVYPYVQGSFDSWEYQEDKIDIVRCFDVAMKYMLYFSAMLPLRESLKDYVKELYEPLLEQRNGELTNMDIDGLRRFAEEFGFNWEQKGVTLA